MRLKGFTAAAIALLALAGCAQPNEEKVRAGEALERLLEIQEGVIADQEQLIARLDSDTWRPKPYAARLKEKAEPLGITDAGRARTESVPGAEGSSALVVTAADDLAGTTGLLAELLEGLERASRHVELSEFDGWPEVATPGPIEEGIREAEEAQDELELFEAGLEGTRDSSTAALSEIKSELEESGNLEEDLEARIADARAQLEATDGDRIEAVADLKQRFASEIDLAKQAVEEAEQLEIAKAMPDGACAIQPVGYPSTLGKPSVYVYVFNGVICEFGKQLALSLFSDSTFRETGSGYLTPAETGPLPEWAEQTFICELGQVSPIGEPRMVLCFPEGETNNWAAPRVAFEAPSTAG